MVPPQVKLPLLVSTHASAREATIARLRFVAACSGLRLFTRKFLRLSADKREHHGETIHGGSAGPTTLTGRIGYVAAGACSASIGMPGPVQFRFTAYCSKT
jgi:hypothetical protein